MRLVLINHTFQERFTYRRWQLFAQDHPDVDIILLAPREYRWFSDKNYTFGQPQIKCGKEMDESNFHIRLFEVQQHRFSGWTSPDFKKLLCSLSPDIIYNIGTHMMSSLYQIIGIRNRYLPKTKVICFSMRGPAFNLKENKTSCSFPRRIGRRIMYRKSQYLLKRFNRYCDAVFCHYPDAMDCFIKEGYIGPIYMQTQVGFNQEWFHPDEGYRREIRDKYGISDSYVFGSATRLTEDKGILDILRALPRSGNWKYLMMGSGNDNQTETIKKEIEFRGLSDKVIMTGMIDEYEMAKYWNAVDCALHVPRTTDYWEETFSIALAQAMGTSKPVIGSSSGSVPYQIGPDGIIVQEGDCKALADKIDWVLHHQEDADKIGERMYERAVNCFSVDHLNRLFYETIIDIQNGIYDDKKIDMTKYGN